MRLVNCETLKLEEFFSRPIPPYYILSHRWTSDEITFQDYAKGRRKDSQGYKKIIDCCRFILDRHHAVPMTFRDNERGGFTFPEACYVWIDTCCIDKKSSAELSEAINSMYKYYANAFRCYALIADIVPIPGYETTETVHLQLQTSQWFTRGWTLQELLAPQSVVFVDDQWKVLGHKCTQPRMCRFEKSFDVPPDWGPVLNDLLAQITGIDAMYLANPAKIHSASIACRMSWASKRTTTRIEDTAYCLLGLLQVNMPLLYGEEEMAFFRLQEELVKDSTDQSIFAWTPNEAEYGQLDGDPKTSGIFARSPADFEHSGAISTTESETWPYMMTNIGIDLQTVAQRSRLSREAGLQWFQEGREIFIVRLNCRLGSMQEGQATGSQDDEEEDPDSSPIDIALVQYPLPRRYPGVTPLRLFQRIHDFGRMLADSCTIGPPEYVHLYVRAFDEVEVLPWRDPDWLSLLSTLALDDLRIKSGRAGRPYYWKVSELAAFEETVIQYSSPPSPSSGSRPDSPRRLSSSDSGSTPPTCQSAAP